ncbi:hypothetical protein H0H81_012030 [Sphagnurus paluster]|uniref:non-specific serine/threonine protein kinase n=1 Tax=Sphagnurus paluster TaxID=117069 RepID=A0A9P7G0C7_9AGAR|nr:hypothetical protein H0H81_012030 [Sphagnurus paluster]
MSPLATPVTTPQPYQRTYVWKEDVENLERYCPGGYHPVHIDDEILGRYHILHKLGFGSYSTVWLAKDLQKDRFVALKFIVASESAESPDIRILRHLATSNPSHPGRRHMVNLLDDFKIEGPNGTHQCLVTEVVGPGVGKIKHELPKLNLPVPIAKRVASQCAQALAFMHSSGVAHGDFHTGNILFVIPDFHSWSIEKVYEHFGKPYKEPIKRTDGQPLTPAAPRYAVAPTYPLDLAEIVMNEDCTIKVTDFGQSFFHSESPKTLHTAIAYAAPEILFEDVITPKVDSWSLACMIYELVGTHTLLESFFGDREGYLIEMVRTFGKLPERWWKQWDRRSTFFEEGGAFKPDSGDDTGEPRTVDLKERLLDIRREDDETQRELTGDLDMLERLLEPLLKYEPAERANIEDILMPF